MPLFRSSVLKNLMIAFTSQLPQEKRACSGLWWSVAIFPTL